MTDDNKIDVEESELRVQLLKRIEEANSIIDTIDERFADVDGASKVKNRLKSELKFLNELKRTQTNGLKKYIDTSNVIHFRGLLDAAIRYKQCSAFYKALTKPEQKKGPKLEIDLVVEDGAKWVKVVSRSARGLAMEYVGAGSGTSRSVLEQAEDYVKMAEYFPYFFRAPEIIFEFLNGVPDLLAKRIEAMGIRIAGERIAMNELIELPEDWDESEEDSLSCDCSRINQSSDQNEFGGVLESEIVRSGAAISVDGTEAGNEYGQEMGMGRDCGERREDDGKNRESGIEVGDREESGKLLMGEDCKVEGREEQRQREVFVFDTVNLDVTAVFVLISSLTHPGGCQFQFNSTLLNAQAQLERRKPALAPLLKAIKGKKLIMCRTAYDSVQSILSTVAGPQEKRRAKELFERVQIVEDRVTGRAAALKISDKISARSKIIFASGDFYKAVTVSANRHFVSAASHQGINFAVILHDSRALSEQKQAVAERLLP